MRNLVVFDLDGTLVRGDTFLRYLIGFLVRHPHRVGRLITLPVAITMFYAGVIDNTRLKKRFLAAFLGGVAREQIERWTDIFVRRLLAGGMRRAGLVILEGHRRAGDGTVLLTASPDVYVQELGRRLGFDHVMCTEVAWDGDCLTGDLAGPNRHGVEKLRCLQALRHTYPEAKVTAYADHFSDFALLQAVDEGVLVNGDAGLKRLAKQRGIGQADWRD